MSKTHYSSKATRITFNMAVVYHMAKNEKMFNREVSLSYKY